MPAIRKDAALVLGADSGQEGNMNRPNFMGLERSDTR